MRAVSSKFLSIVAAVEEVSTISLVELMMLCTRLDGSNTVHWALAFVPHSRTKRQRSMRSVLFFIVIIRFVV